MTFSSVNDVLENLLSITAATNQNLLHVIVHRHLGKVLLCAPQYLWQKGSKTPDQNIHQDCIITHGKVGVVAGRSELVASHDKEDKGGNLLKQHNGTINPFLFRLVSSEVKSGSLEFWYIMDGEKI